MEFLFEPERPFEEDFKVNVLAQAASHPAGDNPDNDSHEYLLLQDVIKINVDGTSAHYHHRLVRILNQQGAKKHDFFATWFDASEQKSRFITARVIHPDGSIEEAKIDNRDHKTLENQRRLPSMVDLPALKPGDIVDVEYRTDDLQQSFFGDYYGYRPFFQPGDLKAVYDARFTLILPTSRTFQFNQKHMEMQPESTIDEENLAPARARVHDLFLDHVMREAPGFGHLTEWTDGAVMPTPSAVGVMLR